MPNLQVEREILLRRRRMDGERNEERDSERPGRGLVKKRERRPGEVLGAPFERRHLGAGARLSALSPLAIKRQWADSVPGRRFGGCPFPFTRRPSVICGAFWELPRVQASLRSPCRRACQNRLDQSAHRRTQACEASPPVRPPYLYRGMVLDLQAAPRRPHRPGR